MEDVLTLAYADFMGAAGVHFIRLFFIRLRKVKSAKGVRRAFVEGREIAESLELPELYRRHVRRASLERSVGLVDRAYFKGLIVDLGADDNVMGEVLLDRYWTQIDFILGIDMEARPGVRKGPKLGFVVQNKDSLTLPVGAGVADVVTARLSLHHMPYEQQEAYLKEMDRILKPGGRVLVYEDSPSATLKPAQDPYDWDARVKRLLKSARGPERIKLFLSAMDVFSHSLKSKHQPFPFAFRVIEDWGAFFQKAGFAVEKLTYFGIPIVTLHQSPLGVFILRKGTLQSAGKAAAKSA
jgi:SAM-dependent methyltransferase